MTHDSAAIIEQVRQALSRAFSLGQTYWRLADSESYKQNAKAGETHAKFDALKEETCAALRADRRQIVELCAAVCIEQGRKDYDIDSEAFYIATGQCAAALLALLDGEAK